MAQEAPSQLPFPTCASAYHDDDDDDDDDDDEDVDDEDDEKDVDLVKRSKVVLERV